MIYGYIRVSTDKQTTENQRFEIEKFATTRGIVIDKWVAETISATTDLKKRKLGKLMSQLKTDDLIIASEISRLGRNLLQIMGILNIAMNNGAKIWTIKDNYRLNAGIESKVLAFAFGLSAEIERNLIADRTREALVRMRAAGLKVGRPSGSVNKQLKLAPYQEKIQKMMSRGYSKSKIARQLRCSRQTLNSFLGQISENLYNSD